MIWNALLEIQVLMKLPRLKIKLSLELTSRKCIGAQNQNKKELD